MYHLEGEGIIWSSRVSSGGVYIIWRERVSSGAGEYHLAGCVSFGRGGYHLEQESIIWRGVCIRVGRFLTKILILNESTLGIYSFL
jgi:hypothetical protein